MGVQKEILTSQGPEIVLNPAPGAADKKFVGGVGTLAIGKPGDIVARAFGPLTYAEVLGDDIEMGTFVEGKGVLVNSNDVPNRQNFDENLVVKAGDTAAFMTYGTCVVLGKNVQAILDGMNARVVYGGEVIDDDAHAYEVEVTGFKAAAAAPAPSPDPEEEEQPGA